MHGISSSAQLTCEYVHCVRVCGVPLQVLPVTEDAWDQPQHPLTCAHVHFVDVCGVPLYVLPVAVDARDQPQHTAALPEAQWRPLVRPLTLRP